ncbi:MAG: hypothetical protein OXN97_11815 [Bryobacterales bacterium]|nr:hypothetical protein [Bryobacterales bacterium]
MALLQYVSARRMRLALLGSDLLRLELIARSRITTLFRGIL